MPTVATLDHHDAEDFPNGLQVQKPSMSEQAQTSSSQLMRDTLLGLLEAQHQEQQGNQQQAGPFSRALPPASSQPLHHIGLSAPAPQRNAEDSSEPASPERQAFMPGLDVGYVSRREHSAGPGDSRRGLAAAQVPRDKAQPWPPSDGAQLFQSEMRPVRAAEPQYWTPQPCTEGLPVAQHGPRCSPFLIPTGPSQPHTLVQEIVEDPGPASEPSPRKAPADAQLGKKMPLDEQRPLRATASQAAASVIPDHGPQDTADRMTGVAAGTAQSALPISRDLSEADTQQERSVITQPEHCNGPELADALGPQLEPAHGTT